MFAAAAAEYLAAKKSVWAHTTYQNEKLNIDKLSAMFGNRLVTDVQGELVKKYQDHRLAQGAAPKTVNLEFGSLRAVLIRCKVWANIRSDVRMLPVVDEVGYALTDAEEDRLIQACEQSTSRYLPFVVITALSTGMRRNEIRFLKWFQVNFNQRVITVGMSKTRHGTGRRIPMNDRLSATLSKWAAEFPNRSPEDYVFPG